MPRTFTSANTTTSETERLVGLSDAVFAIAITFLALDLSDLGSDFSPDHVATFLSENVASYLVYGFSFLIVGFQWWRHHWMFRFVKYTSQSLDLLTFLTLAIVALLPYPVAVVGKTLTSGSGLAILLFAVPVAVIGLLFWCTFELALKQGLTMPGLPVPVIANVRATLLVSPIVFSFSSLLATAAWLGDNETLGFAAFASWALLFFGRPVLNRFWPLASGIVETAIEDDDDKAASAAARGIIERVRNGSDTDRLVVFNDGVYAIALTILALRVRPESSDPSNQEILANLTGQWATWYAYFLTFWFVEILWSVHCRMFRRINVADPVLLWMNLVHLMLIAFLPLPVELFASAGTSLAAVWMYELFLALCFVTLAVMGSYAVRHGYAVKLGPRDGQYRIIRTGWIVSVFILAMAIAPFIPRVPALSGYAMFLLIPMNRVLRRRFPDESARDFARG